MTSFIQGQCEYGTSLIKEAIFDSGTVETRPPTLPQIEEGSFEDIFEMNLLDGNLKQFQTAIIGEPIAVQGIGLFSILKDFRRF